MVYVFIWSCMGSNFMYVKKNQSLSCSLYSYFMILFINVTYTVYNFLFDYYNFCIQYYM